MTPISVERIEEKYSFIDVKLNREKVISKNDELML